MAILEYENKAAFDPTIKLNGKNATSVARQNEIIEAIFLVIIEKSVYFNVKLVLIEYHKISLKGILMNYKAIIFDMDGTIVSTEVMWQIATQTILDKHTNHLSQTKKDEIKTYLKGLALYESCKHIAQHSLIAIDPEMILQEKLQLAHDMYETHDVTYIPHFPEFHGKAIEHGLKTAIATNAVTLTVERTLEQLPLQNFFAEHIYNIDMVNKVCKPNPAIFLHAAKKIGIDPKDCIVIEDSVHGIKAAKAAGMYCIAINTGNDRHLLHEADEIVDCYREIDLDKLLYKK
jgi:HAD superfamily hydrolase (TIGR01509 family)